MFGSKWCVNRARHFNGFIENGKALGLIKTLYSIDYYRFESALNVTLWPGTLFVKYFIDPHFNSSSYAKLLVFHSVCEQMSEWLGEHYVPYIIRIKVAFCEL